MTFALSCLLDRAAPASPKTNDNSSGDALGPDQWVDSFRPDSYLTGPLRQAISEGLINLRFIP